jgi:hypothetical protein
MIPLRRWVEFDSAPLLTCLALGLLLLLGTWTPVSADQLFSSDRIRPDNRSFPITELRMVREPGNLHYVQTNDGEFVLTDYWWREVKVGERRFAGRPPGPGIPPVAVPEAGPPTTQGRKKVFVEIVAGKGYQFFGKEKIKPVSFTLIEDLPRNVPIRYGNSRGTLVAAFDGYHVDLGLEQAARVIRGYNGVVQDLGDGQGLQDVAVIVYWEEDDQGEALMYQEGAPESPAVDDWGLNLKSKVQSRKAPVDPSAEPVAPAPEAPSAAPEASQP